MSTAQITTVPTRPSALALMAERCSVDPAKLHATLKNTVFKGATDDELLALVVTANVYDLNPLLKELYAFPKKGGGIAPMVGIDGWIKIANRQPNFDGMEPEVFGDGKTPTHATCVIHLKDRKYPVKITEYFEECRRSTDPWNQMPRRMLRNKVIIQTIRVAFGIGGIHDEDEAEDISLTSEPRAAKTRTVTEVKDNPYTPDSPAVEVEASEVVTEQAAVIQEEQTDGKIQGFFDKVTVKDSPAGAAREWRQWKLIYTTEGKEQNAVTYSATLGAQLEALEEGTPIIITVKSGPKGDTLETLEAQPQPEGEW